MNIQKKFVCAIVAILFVHNLCGMDQKDSKGSTNQLAAAVITKKQCTGSNESTSEEFAAQKENTSTNGSNKSPRAYKKFEFVTTYKNEHGASLDFPQFSGNFERQEYPVGQQPLKNFQKIPYYNLG